MEGDSDGQADGKIQPSPENAFPTEKNKQSRRVFLRKGQHHPILDAL